MFNEDFVIFYVGYVWVIDILKGVEVEGVNFRNVCFEYYFVYESYVYFGKFFFCKGECCFKVFGCVVVWFGYWEY